MQAAGKYILIAGLVIAALGLILWVAGDKLTWLGRLPGDIRYETDNVKIYFPITTMILISIFLSLAWWLARRLF